MDVFDLVAKISLDTSGYESSLNKSKGLLSKFSGGITSKAVAVGNLVSGAISKAAGKVADFSKQTINTGMSFDSAMSQVAATMGKTVNGISKEQETATVRGKKFTGNLRDYAKFVGETTEYSATQAAQALNYMALAGYDTKKSMDTLPNVLNLASAGAMDMATASDRVTDAETALNVHGKDLTRMIDQIAMASSKTNTNVDQLSEAFLTVGANAKSMAAGSIPETKEMSMVLGVMADNGIKGAEAGTHLRNILRRFAKPTDDSAAAMKQLGVSAYDAQGNLRDLPTVFMEIAKAEQGMTQKEKDTLNTALFNGYDLAAVNSLIGTTADRWNQVGDALDNAQGSAEKMATTQMDNMAGDMKLFQSALEAVQIAISDKVTPALRKFVQIGTDGLSSLAQAINNGDVKGIGDAFANTIIAAADRLIKYLPQIMEVLTKVLNAVTNALVKIIPEILPQLIPVLISSVAKIGGAVVKNIPAIISSLIQGIGASFDKPGDMLASALFLAFAVKLKHQPFGNAISSIFSTIGDAGKFIGKALPAFNSLGTSMKGVVPAANGLGGAFKALWGVLTANPIGLIITLIAGVTVALVALYKKNEKFRNFVNGFFGEVKNLFSGLVSNIKGAFDKIGGFFGNIRDHFIGLRKTSKSSLDGVSNDSKSFADNVSKSFNNKIPIAINNLKSAFRSLRSNGSNVFSSLKNTIKGFASSAQSNLGGKLKNVVSNAKGLLKNFSSNAKKSFDGLISRCKKVPGDIQSAMKSLPGKLHSIGSKAMNQFRNAFKGIHTIGSNIIAGIRKGMDKEIPKLKKKIKSFGHNVVDWFKDTFKIGSPSKVMRDQVGKYVAQGMIVGMEKENKKAKKSAEHLAGTVVKSAQSVVLASSPEFDGIADRIYKDIDDPKYHLTAKQRAEQQKKKRQEQADARSERKATKQTTKKTTKSKLPSDEELEKMRQELLEENKLYNDPKARWRLRKEQEKKAREEEKEEKKSGKKDSDKDSKKSSKKKSDSKKSDSKESSSKKSSDKVMTEDEFNEKMIRNAQKRVTALKKADQMTEQQEASLWISLSKKVDKGSTAYTEIMAKAAQAQKSQRKKSFKDAEDALSAHELKQNKKSAKYEASYWNTIRKQYKVGTDERKKADKKYYTAKNKIQAEDLKNTKQYWSTYKVYHKTTLKDEVGYLNVARKQFKKGTKERISMDKQYFSKRDSLQKKQASAEKKYLNSIDSANKKYLNSKESAEKKYRSSKQAAEKKLNEALKDAEKDYQEALDKTKEKLKDRKDELTGAFSVLEKFDLGDMLSPDDATKNVDSQLNAMREWFDDIEVLRSKIGGTQLFTDIQKLGVNGLQKVRALNQMSTAELQSDVKKYQEIFDLADKEAHAELDKTIAEENAKSYKTYTDAIAKANDEYQKSLATAQKTLNDSLAKAADTYNTSVSKAYDTFKSSMEKVGLKVSNSSKKVKNAVKSTRKSYSGELDKMSSKTSSSMNSMVSRVATSFNKMSKSSKNSAKDMVDNFIHGLNSKSSDLGKAVDNLIKKQIYKKLHFSEPDEGPLSNFHTYAPDMIDLFTKGINDNGYKIGEALDKNIQLKDMASRVQDAIVPRLPQSGQLNIPGLPSLTPVSGQTDENKRPIDLHITMNVDRTAFARMVYRLNKEETQRVGVSLATGAGI